MTAFSRLSVTTGLALLLGLGVGACNPPPGQPGMSSLTENRCGVHRVAGEATSEYVMCVMGTRGTARGRVGSGDDAERSRPAGRAQVRRLSAVA